MRTRSFLPAFCAAGLLLWSGTAAAAQKPEPPKDLNGRIPVYVTALEPGANASEFTQPGADIKGIADSVKDIQSAFTVVKTKWVRLVADRAAAVMVIGVTRRTYDDGPEIMSVYTDVSVDAYTFAVTGAGDPWRNAAKSVVKQLDEWVGVNYPKLRERMPGQGSSKQ